MQGRRNSNDPMDLSGRSAGSSSSNPGMPSQAGFPLPQMMAQQPRFQPPGSPFQQRGFPSSPSQQQPQPQPQPQQQQYYQMQQMQQLRMQQMQQQPPSSPRNSLPYQMSPSQQQQRRPSSSAAMSPPSIPRPLASPPTVTTSTTTLIKGDRSLSSSSKGDTTTPTSNKASSMASSNSASNRQTAATSAPSTGPLSKEAVSLGKPSANANANESATASKTTTSKPTSGKTAAKSTSHKSATSTTATAAKTAQPEPLAPEQAQQLLSQTNWVDRTLWVSRQLLGGHAVNGFLRATATSQRVKKQRARQTAAARAKQQAGSSNHNPNVNVPNSKNAAVATTTGARTTDNSNLSEQEAEEVLKKEVMNARTAKKFKTEMEGGLQFCEMLYGTIRTILNDMDPLFIPPPPLDKALPNPNAKNLPPPSMMLPPPPVPTMAARNSMSSSISAASSNRRGPTSTTSSLPPPSPLQQQKKLMSLTGTQTPLLASNSGSMLRKQRRKKLPPSNEPAVVLSEYDESGKKKFSKKEQLYRMAEVIRFRALRKGDFVAARLSSRDLWILARVLEDYKSFDVPPAKFLQLSGPRRDQLFREKVMIEDVEDKQDGTPVLLSRSLVLPLPRSFSEAAEWGTRVKKGTRVYAMYPQTTSLYSATVVDNTTYCRQDDDIIVVEFDGDEPDATGQIPKCHIPARFVVIIPREFPASQPSSSGKKRKDSSQHGSTASKKSATAAAASNAMVQSVPASLLDDTLNLDDMNFEGALQGLDGFDDLDFDLLGGT